MSIKAVNTVKVGDAGVDILAGRNAGLKASIGITHGFGTIEELRAAKSDYILDSLADSPEVINSIE